MASRGCGRHQAESVPKDPTNFMDTQWEMAYAMREQAATAHQMMNKLRRQPEGGCEGNLNGPEVDLEYLKFT